MKTFRPDYDQLTSQERVHLSLAALERADLDEVDRLAESCPPVKATIGDPAFTELLESMNRAGMEALVQWLDVSHQVARARTNVVTLQRILGLEKLLDGDALGCARELKVINAKERDALAIFEAQHQQWSARWKSIEAAITRFCAEWGITTQQMLAIVKRRPAAIDQARADLADVPADPQEEATMYEILCDIVSGQDADDEG
jgi:hypothetical protein